MTASSLSLVLPDLVDPLASADPVALQRAVSAGIQLALARTRLADARIDLALAALATGATNGPAHEAVSALVDDLDEKAFDLQDRLEAGENVEGEHRLAFARARAAAAVAMAFDRDALHGAFESLYEAHFAVEDPGDLRATVLAALA